ncbi:hypothetical protein CAAN1_21S02124 [[Candida] anglica]|uniref:Alcohol acetyltransferase n=1 Tax=[Candida] anglica TaxID=148631 RepID=A0ABP0EE14_9ASCO
MRSPGYFESHFICRNLEGYYTNFNVSARYSRKLTAEVLSNALQHLINNEIILSLNFFRCEGSTRQDDHCANGANFELRSVSNFKFNDVVSFETVDRIDASVFQDLNSLICPVNVELPLWRIVVYESKEDDSQHVCIYFEHALFDGSSGVQFHRDIASALDLDDTATTVVETFSTSKSCDSIPKACEDTTDLFDASLSAKLSFFAQKYIPTWTSKIYTHVQSLVYPAEPKSPEVFKYGSTVYGTKNYELFHLNSNDLNKVVEFCRENKIAITSYVAILSNLTFTETFLKALPNESSDDGIWSTLCSVALNGRRHVPREKFQYGTIVIPDLFKLEPVSTNTSREKLIKQMQDFHKRLHTSVDEATCFQRVGLFKYINNWDFYQAKSKSIDRSTISISNLGSISVNGKWKLLDMWFSQDLGLANNFLFNMISTPNNGLNIVLCYRPEFGQVQDKTGEIVIDLFVKNLSRRLVEFARGLENN